MPTPEAIECVKKLQQKCIAAHMALSEVIEAWSDKYVLIDGYDHESIIKGLDDDVEFMLLMFASLKKDGVPVFNGPSMLANTALVRKVLQEISIRPPEVLLEDGHKG